MADLQGIHGASLVPNTLQNITQGLGAGQQLASQFLTPDLLQAAQGGDQQALAQLIALNPEAATNLTNIQGAQQTQKKQQFIQAITESRAESITRAGNIRKALSGGPESIVNNLSKLVRDNSEDQEFVREAIEIANLAQTEPEEAVRRLQDALAGAQSEIQIADQIMGQAQPKGFTLGEGQQRFDAAGNVIATGQPKSRDGRADPIPAEQRTFEALISDFTPEQQKSAKLIKAGLKGRAMSNALLSAIESGDVTNLSDARAQIKQAEKFAELTGTSRAKFIDKGFDNIVKINKNIRNMGRAVTALEGGASTGVIESRFFPSFRKATLQLEALQKELALDVIGSVTFGALSQGELDLAKEVALPTNLEPADLKDHLVDRIAAQEKLRGYYQDQIDFLDKGGTIAGFLREQERSAGPQTVEVDF